VGTHIEPLLTIADLDSIRDDFNRYEWIEGKLFVSEVPSLTHQSVLGNFFHSLSSHLIQNPIGRVWYTLGVTLSESTCVIPDLIYVSNDRLAEIASGDCVIGSPDLVIEIVSPGAENERRDRLVKRQLYSKYGVKEYWIVDFQNRTIEVYVLQGQMLQLNALLTEKDELTSSMLPGYRCKVETLFLI
jgi:Uma2 family endonuclease